MQRKSREYVHADQAEEAKSVERIDFAPRCTKAFLPRAWNDPTAGELVGQRFGLISLPLP